MTKTLKLGGPDEVMIFFREDGWIYPIQGCLGRHLALQAKENADLNPGTIRVEDTKGTVLWAPVNDPSWGEGVRTRIAPLPDGRWGAIIYQGPEGEPTILSVCSGATAEECLAEVDRDLNAEPWKVTLH